MKQPLSYQRYFKFHSIENSIDGSWSMASQFPVMAILLGLRKQI